ncbi:MAG: hypothetical protein QM726_18635 [Chitinophagaceae bacterium]
MQQQIIRLCYRKIIDANATLAWDKYVFDSSYAEFLMQSQLYNQEKKYTSFADILLHVPNAEKLHFLVSAAITGYLQQLNGKIPDILDNLGRRFLSFKNYRFEIINSDIKKKEQHQVAINFFSEPLLWHNTIGNYLLVSEENAASTNDGNLTNVLQLQSFLSIYSIKEKHYDTTTN